MILKPNGDGTYSYVYKGQVFTVREHEIETDERLSSIRAAGAAREEEELRRRRMLARATKF
jgi:hypothetical protein